MQKPNRTMLIHVNGRSIILINQNNITLKLGSLFLHAKTW